MKIVIACDSFKGSLSSQEAGEAVAEGVRDAIPDVETIIIPIADGGEGTVDAVVHSTHGVIQSCAVTDPLARQIYADYAICSTTAIIEMAKASGLTLLAPGERNPMHATTYGTGLLIADALRRGCRDLMIGIGGSATNDGGTGMLRALGYRFIDTEGKEITDNIADLVNLKAIDDHNILPELKETRFTVACDVSNPLIGPNGASHIFGPQKGASPADILILDKALSRLAAVTTQFTGKDFTETPGSGAGGGIAFALMAYLGADIRSGIDMVLDTVRFDHALQGASLVITGEGRLDQQTCMGKAPSGVLHRALKRNIPVIGIGGSISPEATSQLKEAGFSEICAATPPGMPLDEAMQPATARQNIRNAVGKLLTGLINAKNPEG